MSAADVPGCNVIGNDDFIFADKEVTTVGQLIGIVVAKSKPLAQRAVEAVKVEYTDLPAILTIQVRQLSLLILKQNRKQLRPSHSISLSATLNMVMRRLP